MNESIGMPIGEVAKIVAEAYKSGFVDAVKIMEQTLETIDVKKLANDIETRFKTSGIVKTEW